MVHFSAAPLAHFSAAIDTLAISHFTGLKFLIIHTWTAGPGAICPTSCGDQTRSIAYPPCPPRPRWSTQRHKPLVRDDEQALTNDIVELATRFGRYGYRRVTALLRGAGWEVNHKRVERILRQEGLTEGAGQAAQGRAVVAE